MSRFMATKYPYHPKEKNWLYVPNTHTHTWIYTCVHIHMYITHMLHSHPHAHTHTWIYTQVHIHTYITHTLHTVTHEYTHMCIYINTPHTLYPHTHTHTHTWLYTHAHIHIYITIPYIHTRTHTLTHVQANIWYTSYPILYLSHWLPQECSMRVTRPLCDHHYYVNCGVWLHVM